MYLKQQYDMDLSKSRNWRSSLFSQVKAYGQPRTKQSLKNINDKDGVKVRVICRNQLPGLSHLHGLKYKTGLYICAIK